MHRRTLTIKSFLPGDEVVQALLKTAPQLRHLYLDVFDTLVVRTCGSPVHLFSATWRYLRKRSNLQVERLAYVQNRRIAEEAMLQRHGRLDSHVRLQDIYREFCYRLHLDSSWIDLLVDSELVCERLALRPTALGSALHDLASMTRLILISDMYLTVDQLRYVLHDALGDLRDIEVFTSQEVAASKSSGRIFPLVLTSTGAVPRHTLHAGDSLGADVRQPRRYGIRTAHLANGEFNRYESTLVSAEIEPNDLGGMLAGASRSVRLGASAPTSVGAQLAVATGVLAPLSISFTFWALKKAVSHKCSQIVFLARDGKIPYSIAVQLIKALDMPIRPRYLYVSRRTTNLAGSGAPDSETLAWVLRGAMGQKFGTILSRVGLDSSDIFEKSGEVLSPDRRIDALGLKRLRSILTDDEVFGLIREKARQEYRLVLDQFKQDEIDSTEQLAFVDGGGTGSQIASIDNIVRSLGNDSSRFLLFGLDQHADKDARVAIAGSEWIERTEAWVFDEVRGYGFPKFRGLSTVMQIALAPTHGSIVGYERGRMGDNQIPVQDNRGQSELQAWGVTTVHDSAIAMARAFDPEVLQASSDVDIMPSILENVRLFYGHPTIEEATVWGDYPFESGDMEALHIRPLATPYTLRRVVRVAIGREHPFAYGHWHEGCVRRSHSFVRLGINLAELVYRALKRLKARRM